MNVLILDDIKHRHDVFDSIYDMDQVDHAYSYTDFCRLLNSKKYNLIQLDHDLGDFVDNPDTYTDGWGKDQQYTGYHAAQAIVDLPDNLLPDSVIIHSVNPVGARKMMLVLTNRGIKVSWNPFTDPSDMEDM